MNISGALDLIAAWLPRKPAVFLCLTIIWVVTLWFLSAGHPAPKNAPSIPHLDKLAHFIYFLGGGAAMAAFAGLKWGEMSRKYIFLGVLLICCVIGRLDEYHQSFTPGRTGNDTGDWVADTLGGGAGGWLTAFLLLPRMVPQQGKSRKFP